MAISITDNGNADLGITRKAGLFTIYASGTFGGGTLKVQASPDGSAWFDVPNGGGTLQLTSAGIMTVAIAADALRVVLSGATSPSLSVWMRA